MYRILLSLVFTLCCVLSYAQTNLIAAGSSWKYLDNGVYPGSTWTSTSFNDASWASGNAELGYGDGDESTVVSYGPSSSNKYITTWFRKTFFVPSISSFTSLNLEFVRDDGIVIYINGVEVTRDNMPGGAINDQTGANSAIAWPNEDDWHTVAISPLYLTSGNNTIAVEIHQDNGGSSDISFNLKLDALSNPITAVVDRGPYLNLATDNSIIIKWRTDVATDSKVWFGQSFLNLSQLAIDPNTTTNHEVKITGLNPYTKYYYAVGHSSAQLTTPGVGFQFRTAPTVGTSKKYRFWVTGDAGTGNNNQRSARDAFLNYVGSYQVDGWMWLGDNAYDGGFDSEYQSNVFSNNTYEVPLRKYCVWPAIGNHDYNNNIPFSPSPAYFDIFTLPTNGEAGGLPSGTEAYYSYNYGNIHFIALDSYNQGRGSSDPMAQWLTSDLANNTLPWVIAYWHHPPYTKGTHDSDNGFPFIDGELPEIRQNIIPILENAGVDLILNGHSHVYERSYLLDGHYGNSGSFNSSTMALDASSGTYPSSCPYQKNTSITNSHQGTVYVVCGCSGKNGSTASGWPHPAFYKYTNTEYGSMLIEVNGNRLDGKFITSTNNNYDSFTIVKNAGSKQVITACPNEQVSLVPSWPATVNWWPVNQSADSIHVSSVVSTYYIASDALNCIRDTFYLNIVNNPNCATAIDEMVLNQVSVFPTVLNESSNYTLSFSYPSEFEGTIHLIDLSGKTIKSVNAGTNTLFVGDLSKGIYLVELNQNGASLRKKIIIN